MSSCSLWAWISSISPTNRSVSFWSSFSARTRSSSEMSPHAQASPSLPWQWRRTLRTATRPSSARVCTCFTSSLRRSSVSGGKASRITWPSLDGVMPRSLDWIAFSIRPRAFLSNGRDRQQPRLGDVDRGELVQRHRRPVVLHGDAVAAPPGVGASRADAGEFLLEMGDRLLHLVRGVLEARIDRSSTAPCRRRA